jgi:hypothetical protein
MVIPDILPVPTDVPLRDQRPGLRERTLAVFGRRQRGQESEGLPTEGRVESETQPARHPWTTRPAAVVRQIANIWRVRPADTLVSSSVPQPTVSSATAAAALVQRITGPGSGPYSGTPFLVAPRPTEAAAQPQAADEPSEAARHDHGIIDHSRHVSSIGRR